MRVVHKAMVDAGLPPADPLAPEASTARFSDGAHYRIEIAGVERLSTMETMVQECERRQSVVHRVIASVAGSVYLERQELREMAQLAAEKRIEVIMTPGPQRGMDTGRQFTTPEGLVSGMRVRGQDNLAYVVKEILRCAEAGFRGFLVTDEGLLWLLNRMREQGDIPPETVFKISVFAGHANAAGCKVVEMLGADSINPLADLSLPMLSAIRKTIRVPMDVYVMLVRAMGGFNRCYEAAGLAKACAPCYFKFEPGESEAAIYAPWNDAAFHNHMLREKLRYVSIVNELVAELDPEIKLSAAGPADLAVPRP